MNALSTLVPAKGGPRECGPGRQQGHIYAECGFGAGGATIEHFLIDHPVAVNPAHLGLSTQGVTLLERQGTWHIVDLVGASHYPYPADFIEEARAIGISRKIPRTADFAKLGPGSTLILIHAKGRVTNAAAAAAHALHWACPCGKGHPASDPCAAWHWYAPDVNLPGTLKRKLKRATYEVKPLYGEPPLLDFTPAYFLQVPISNLSVIRNQDGTVDPLSRDIAGRARLPILHADT